MSAILDPRTFASLGALSLTSGAYKIVTDGGPGGAPVLEDASNAVLYTGVSVAQGGAFDPSIGVLDFNSISIAAGVTVTVTGSQPIALLSQSTVSLAGTISAIGGTGTDGVFRGAGGLGGTGVAGGASGGAGGAYQGPGISGTGPGAGPSTGYYGVTQNTIGTGAGYGGQGGHPTAGTFGSTYGDLTVSLQGGSGGAGSGSAFAGGGGGGGGGGGIELGATGTIDVTPTGQILANGGAPGVSGDVFGYNGGGGSGGGIILDAPTVTLDSGAASQHAVVAAAGGGNNGGGGRILFETSDGTVNGTATAANLIGVSVAGGNYSQSGVISFGTLACFATGTGIATARGRVPVETMGFGDVVLTQDGGTQKVVWIGRRRVDCRRHPRPAEVWPVHVHVDAFGPGMPVRDVLLSPDHAVAVSGVLVPIRLLVDGVAIAQEPVDSVVYWHVELERHDVLFADGLPAESYLDTGNRDSFANGGAAVAAQPAFAREGGVAGCLPLVTGGERLDAIRLSLASVVRNPTPALAATA